MDAQEVTRIVYDAEFEPGEIAGVDGTGLHAGQKVMLVQPEDVTEEPREWPGVVEEVRGRAHSPGRFWAGVRMAEAVSGKTVTADDIDRWTRHLWHASQHNRMVIGLGGRLQRLVHEMREAAGLAPFGWNTAFPDAEFGECTVHVEGCRGQETHP